MNFSFPAPNAGDGDSYENLGSGVPFLERGCNLEKRRRDPRLKLSSNLSVMIYVCIDTADFMSVLEEGLFTLS